MKIRDVLMQMFQGIKMGYDKKEDRFTGVATLPDEVINLALKQLAGVVRGEKIEINPKHSTHVISARMDFNRAIEHIASLIEKGVL